MDTQLLKNQIMLERQQSRNMAEITAENYIEKLKKDSEFKELYLNYNVCNLNYIKAKHNNVDVSTHENNVRKADEKLSAYLKAHNINRNRLYPQYKCKLCSDKGVINGKMCTCLQEEINARMIKENSTYNSFHTFAMANPSIMTNASIKIFKEMSDWCDNFPNETINISLVGSPGTGKTFLLECIASKLQDNNKNVVFITAFDFNEECRKYHFSLPNKVGAFMNCDCLIIDDLGTEPVLKNITVEYFYNIINLRQVHNKATLLSTNLSLADLAYRYSTRTISRLNNKALSKLYMFNSPIDKRAY